ncbi:uncharacterized protein VTP21DRAFT_8275 [Calcarisporiella thermophila]|uniref:uncharacterized protein n=1 Tax=Calcarisporiella thermophila TaxID=911321 RepID=UPI003743CD41
MVHLWLRAETKPLEYRAALTPTTCKKLLENGFQITVERSDQRIFDDSEYEQLGCTLVPTLSWKTDAPHDAYIIGLKELPENDPSPISHTHIYFAHCFKNQRGWREVMSPFVQGGGTILDLEFLHDEKGRRIAAFGYHAGFAGCGMGLDLWAYRQLRETFPPARPYPSEDQFIESVGERIKRAAEVKGRLPRVMVMGALGRCGTGACDFARKAGIPEENLLRWDLEETKAGGPFSEILDVDVFVNCIYLATPIPPFVTREMLDRKKELAVVVDVSCDTTNPHNPIPIYSVNTTFDEPSVKAGDVDVISIDHLPTLLPRECSEAFTRDLLPALIQLKDRENARVWQDAEKLFNQKAEEMKN